MTPLRERRTNKKIKRKTDLRDSDNYFGDRLQSNSQSLDHRNELRFNVKNHLVPVFADVKEGTYCIDESQIKRLITKKTRAILAPHLLGNIVNWEKNLGCQ